MARIPLNASFSRLLLFSIALFSATLLSSCSADEQTDKSVENLPKSGFRAVPFSPDLPWLNVSRPLELDDLHGKVVILDFWTYGCINCIHVLADLKRLEEKYGHQLLVIGVHTPKFDNEKNLETLRNIVVRYGIEHPVVNDVDFKLGTYYGMRAWPTRVVIDPAGNVLGKYSGEGRYDLFDETISQLLREHKSILDASPIPLKLEKDRFESSILAAPGKIAVSDQYVAISDTLHHRVILADHGGRIQHIFGGIEAGRSDGAAADARFDSPQGLAFGEHGLYVADTGNHLIRYIDLEALSVTTVAGNGRLERYRNGEFDALHIGLASPWGLVLKENELYVAMAGSHQIWRYDTQSRKIRPYAGSGREGIDDGDLKISSFSQPSGLSIKDDWLYVADAEDSAVRRIQLQKGQVETVIGTGLFDFGDKDGRLDHAKLQHVLGVLAYGADQVFIADTYNHKLNPNVA
ncbi:MAG: redoxin domain-containing protein [gamma proteobacterium endosymbiont of Lamellibrachia anaximandri]|nr:redoxin domain-containing protein [gamma proteobacterium endosymbiont of Lamellibrachia anaximandri]